MSPVPGGALSQHCCCFPAQVPVLGQVRMKHRIEKAPEQTQSVHFCLSCPAHAHPSPLKHLPRISQSCTLPCPAEEPFPAQREPWACCLGFGRALHSAGHLQGTPAASLSLNPTLAAQQGLELSSAIPAHLGSWLVHRTRQSEAAFICTSLIKQLQPGITESLMSRRFGQVRWIVEPLQ